MNFKLYFMEEIFQFNLRSPIKKLLFACTKIIAVNVFDLFKWSDLLVQKMLTPLRYDSLSWWKSTGVLCHFGIALVHLSWSLVSFIFASQGFRSWSCLSSPLADWAGIWDPRSFDFYWMQPLLAASNQILANNQSRKHHVYAVENVNTGAAILHLPNHQTVKSTHWSKVISSL